MLTSTRLRTHRAQNEERRSGGGESWLVWLSGLSIDLQTKGLGVQFPVRAHAWVEGQVPSRGCTRSNHTLMFLSLSFSLPSSLSKNKYNLKKKKKKWGEISSGRPEPCSCCEVSSPGPCFSEEAQRAYAVGGPVNVCLTPPRRSREETG